MTHYDYNEEHLRRQIKQRYNRRFFFIAHVGVLAMIYVASLLLPALSLFATVTFLALIPHVVYVAYQEYRAWVEHKVEQELVEQDSTYYAGTVKRKRYADDYDAYEQDVRYELTDDGELAPVSHSDPYSEKPKRKARSYEHDRDEYDYDRRNHKKSRDYDERKRDKRSKKRSKYDTDEFDIKSIVKKIIDIVD